MRSSASNTTARSIAIATASMTMTGCFVLFSLDGYGPPVTLDEAGLAADGAVDEAASPGAADAADAADGLAGRVVFVTSKRFLGGFGGIAAADARCQALASEAGLGGVFKAWLSDDGSSPSKSFSGFRADGGVGASLPLITPDRRQIVAASFAELAAAGPSTPILMTERLTLLPAAPNPPSDDCSASPGEFVWSDTTPRGDRVTSSLNPSAHCEGWALTQGANGRVGRLVDRDAGNTVDWTDECMMPCAATAHLYCFEQ